MINKRCRTVDGSCWKCKERRVICDLQQPQCRRCIAGQQICDYGKTRLKWVNGVTSRTRRGSHSLTQASSTAVQTTITPVVDTDRLMLYFEHMVLPRFDLSETPLHIDLSSISEDQALKNAVTAVANAHFTMYGRTESATTAMTKHQTRSSAIAVFRQQLQSLEGPKAQPQSLFVIAVLLCILDGILEPRDGPATFFHLQGGKAILNQWENLSELTLAENGLAAHSLSTFATMDLIHSVLSGQSPYFEHTWWNKFANVHCWWGTLKTEDPFLDLMSIFSRLARLGHQAHESQSMVPVRYLLPLQRVLETNACRIPPRTLPRSMSVDSLLDPDDYPRSWAVFCSAYRLSAHIYIYRALCGLEVDNQLVQEVTTEGVEAICGMPLSGKLDHCLLFPTLIIGSHCIDPEQRKVIRASLVSTAGFLSFGGIHVMITFMEQLWERADTDWDWWSCFEPLSRRTLLF